MLALGCKCSSFFKRPKHGGSVVVDSLFIVAFVVHGDSVFGPCLAMSCLVSFLVLQSS